MRDAAPRQSSDPLSSEGVPGAIVTIRPAGPGDGDEIQAYVRGLSFESRRQRFLGALNELSAGELRAMTHAPDRGHLTLLAETIADGARVMIGEARYAIAPDGITCEIALSVAESWRRRTLGTRVLEDLARRARALGARRLVGEVLRSNAAMTALARKAGFAITSPIEDARLIRITRDLSLDGAHTEPRS